MTISKNVGRQELISAYVDFAFGDLASGVAAPAIDLPVGAVVVGGEVVVATAWNSATSDALVVGDAGTANRYKTSFSLQATGQTNLVPTGLQCDATNNKVQVTWTGVGAVPSAGAARLAVRYYVNNRSAFAQG